MTLVNELYKCGSCGNIIEVLHNGDDELLCCGGPMVPMTEKVKDVGNEKHVPVIERTPTGVKVTVGSVPHPMEEKHFIEWIELLADDKVYRRTFKPGEKPQAEFCVSAQVLSARDHCNIHGLWKSK
jgi:superoxide reductase